MSWSPRVSVPARSFDMFAKKDDTPPDEPADRLYNEGLYLLNAKKDPKEAVKKFEEVDRQHPYSEWARKSLIMSAYAYYQAGEYDDCVTAAKRYITLHPGSADAAYAQYPDRRVLFRRDSRHHPRPGAHRKGARRARRSHPQISDQRIRDQRQAEDRSRARPARRQGNADRPLLSGTRRTTPAPSTASKWSSPNTRPRGTSKRRWSG